MATKRGISITEEVGNYLCSYEAQRKQLVLIGNDSRIKIWDVTSNKVVQLKEGQHLNKKYTCVAWNIISTDKKNTQVLLGLGTDKGEVILWDALKSKTIHEWSQKVNGHIGQVNDIAFGKSGVIYSCSEDKSVLSWSLLSGALIGTVHTSKEAVTRICASHDASVIAVAGTKIELLDLSSSKVLKKLSGHTNDITSMKFSHDSSLLITSAKDRYIYLWSTDPNSKSSAALKAFTCESNPLFLDFAPTFKDGNYRLLGVTERGIVNIFNYNVSHKTDDHQHSVVKSSSGAANMIFFSQFGSYDNVFLVYGPNLLAPSFHTLSIEDSEGNLLSQVEVTAQSKQQENQMVQSTTVVPKKIRNPVVDSSNAPLPTASMKVPLENGMDVDEDHTTNHIPSVPLIPRTSKTDQQNESNSITIKTALYQALRSSDMKMLNDILRSAGATREIVSQSVRGLPSLYAVKLLQICTEIIQQKESRAHAMHIWIKAIIQYHSSYLISYPDLVRTLSTLYLSIDKKVAVFPKLIKLHGRLDLLVAQYEQKLDVAPKKMIPSFTEESDDDDNETPVTTSLKANLISQANQELNSSEEEDEEDDEDEEDAEANENEQVNDNPADDDDAEDNDNAEEEDQSDDNNDMSEEDE